MSDPTTASLDRVPTFFWDREVTEGELRDILATPDAAERPELFAAMLREARVSEVWRFVTPAEVRDALPELAGRLGRRRDFWCWLIESWEELGLLA